MASKSNIRSMRFSDEIIEMIEAQTGETFTKKFENLVTRCMWELPAKEKELKQIQEQIIRERENLKTLMRAKETFKRNLNVLEYSMTNLAREAERSYKALEQIEV